MLSWRPLLTRNWHCICYICSILIAYNVWNIWHSIVLVVLLCFKFVKRWYCHLVWGWSGECPSTHPVLLNIKMFAQRLLYFVSTDVCWLHQSSGQGADGGECKTKVGVGNPLSTALVSSQQSLPEPPILFLFVFFYCNKWASATVTSISQCLRPARTGISVCDLIAGRNANFRDVVSLFPSDKVIKLVEMAAWLLHHIASRPPLTICTVLALVSQNIDPPHVRVHFTLK